MLRLLQEQYGSPALLEDVAGEQADMVRILELRDSRRRRIAGERAEESRRAQTELNRRQQDEQQRTRQVVETGVALLTPPAVVSGLAALLTNASPWLFLGAFLVSLVVVVLALSVVRHRRR